ncbi:hypothetical protein [Nitratifractor sp.]|uniref:hypothetical protein n=1 Tax=Nitratifractor sp. TaxID=2268144 RepID=UPI002600B980|nr:hypothetical protein [Nitratifractor sp.]
MEKLFAQFNIDAMVFGAIVASVFLAFVLVVVIFSVRYKGQYEKIEDLRDRLKEREEKITMLEESLREVQILNASQRQEIQQFQDLEERYKAEKNKVEEQLALAKERIEAQREKIADLEGKRKELEVTLENTRENLAKANEEIENVRKRNEFWVEQLSELRTKHEAIKSRLRRYES